MFFKKCNCKEEIDCLKQRMDYMKRRISHLQNLCDSLLEDSNKTYAYRLQERDVELIKKGEQYIKVIKPLKHLLEIY